MEKRENGLDFFSPPQDTRKHINRATAAVGLQEFGFLSASCEVTSKVRTTPVLHKALSDGHSRLTKKIREKIR